MTLIVVGILHFGVVWLSELSTVGLPLKVISLHRGKGLSSIDRAHSISLIVVRIILVIIVRIIPLCKARAVRSSSDIVSLHRRDGLPSVDRCDPVNTRILIRISFFFIVLHLGIIHHLSGSIVACDDHRRNRLASVGIRRVVIRLSALMLRIVERISHVQGGHHTGSIVLENKSLRRRGSKCSEEYSQRQSCRIDSHRSFFLLWLNVDMKG